MTRLDEAQERLARALTKLEKASSDRSSRSGASGIAANAALEGELAEARARYERLQGETRAVSDRLGKLIARVRNLLAS